MTGDLLQPKDTQNYHMRFCRRTMLLLGIWPVKTGDFREIFYEIYFWTTFIYYILFTVSAVILAILTWTDNYLTTASSISVVIEHIGNAYKVLIFKSKTFKGLIHELEEKERQIFESKNPHFVAIYSKNAAYNKKIVLFYTIMGTSAISLWFVTPLISNVFVPLGYHNETGVKMHHYIFSSWFPFNPDMHYWAAYLIQFVGCLLGYTYIVHCGAFYISMLSFVTARIKILQHILKNFSKFVDDFRRTYKISEEQAQCLLMKKLVEEHLQIIRFSKRINDCIKYFTLINFVISSFQLSLVAYQVFKLPPLQRIAVFSYFITLSTQLFLTYNAAHTISIESENIATRIFEGDWESYPPKVLKSLQMICIRAQKPLTMTFGPIADVKVNSLFQIFKALYSYICIIMRI